MDEATKEEFAKLNKTIEKGYGAIMEDAADNKTELKTDIVGLQLQTNNIEREVKSIRQELETLQEKVGGIEGYGKDIDHGLERIVAIERHLGIRPKLA
jgi:hypothetical protein